MPDNTLPTTIDTFLLAKESEGVSPRTLFAYRQALARFASWLTREGVTNPAAITPATVRAYFADLHRHGYSVHTVHDYARPVKTFLRFLYFDGLLTVDIMARVKMPPTDRNVIPAFTDDEIGRLLDACDSVRDTALVLFLLDTGCRASEVCALTVGGIDATTGAVQVERGKGGKRRTVYIGTRCRRALARYLASRAVTDDTPLFPSQHDGAHLKPNGLLQLVRRIGRDAGVTCSCHDFRRSFALTCLRNGMDIRRLAALLGHSDLVVVRQYLAVTEQDAQDAHRQFGPVDAIFAKGRCR